jgi:hyperosmotically inducible periplasmic protein
MTRKSTLHLLVAGVFIAGLGACATDRTATERNQTMTEQAGDGWITTKIKSEFAMDKLVSATNIHVNTDNGVVHLSGVAKNRDEANRAIQIARDVKGVKSVRNEMKIEGVGATR